jgi:histidinol-phosphate aminotransferase
MARKTRLEKRLTEIKRLQNYESGEYSLPNGTSDGNDWIKLNANENLFVQQAFFTQNYFEHNKNFDPRLYPQTEKMALIQRLAKYLSLPIECFTIGNGSDELIETVVKVFLRPSERCLSISPTFTMYRIIVGNHGSVYETVPLDASFSLSSEAFLGNLKDTTNLCILCSPNNPTGNQFKRKTIMKIIEEFDGIVLVDEAYAEFAPYSIHNAIINNENLIVLRTFSKAFGLAGLRIGYACASPKLTAALRQSQLPYNVNKFSMRLAAATLNDRKFFLDMVETIKTERHRLITRLNNINGVNAFHSDANFVLIKTEKDADHVFTELKTRKILVRNIGVILNHGKCLRITIGPSEKNTPLIHALEEICA